MVYSRGIVELLRFLYISFNYNLCRCQPVNNNIGMLLFYVHPCLLTIWHMALIVCI